MNRLYTSDVYDFSQLPNPLDVGYQPYCRYDDYNTHIHPEVGTLKFRNLTFPMMHIADMRWHTGKCLELHNDIPSDAISFVFNLTGKQTTRYNSMQKSFDINAGKHYLVHVPEGGFYNRVDEKENIEVFHLSLEKSFFTNVLGSDDSWSDRIRTALEKKVTFTGVPYLLDITPKMWDLIRNLRSAPPSGTAGNLYMQSQALELIALQIEQMQMAIRPEPTQLRAEDVKKLKDLKAYLEDNFLSDMSLVQLSRLSYLNEFKLKNGFKTLFGTTVFGYLRKLKMAHAARLLQDGVPVSTIAYELGYEYPHHFSVAFKNYMGVNPSVYQSAKN